VIPADASAVPIVSDAAVDALYARSGSSRWGLARDGFAAGIRAACRKRVGSAEGAVDDAIVAGLHAEDVGLAIACAEGLPAAWDHFVLTYRPELYRAARAITDEATGRELADSLYADLFGLSERDGERRSLFRYYHGRSKLTTWLRSVLAQRHVDLTRARKRTSSLDDDAEQPAAERLAAPAAIDPTVAQSMRAAAHAVTAALATLDWDDRRRLAYYYVHGLKLVAIGAQFGESEATASRKLERARQTLRRAIEGALSSHGLSAGDVDDWAAVTRQAWDAMLAEALGVPPPQETGPPPFKGKRTP
jgi:RNA polymerase sigma-70 factor, ECF subfamily